MNKPGIKTTEFWLTLVSQLAGFAVLFGWLPQAEADTLVEIVSAVITAAGALAAVIIPLVQYIKSRTVVKINGS